MTTSRFYLCAIPRPVWEDTSNVYGVGISRFVTDALGCERRIAKEVNLANEYSRYTLVCRRMEQDILQSGRLRITKDAQAFHEARSANFFPTLVLQAGYLTLLSRTLDQPGQERLGACFFPPGEVGKHLQVFKRWAKEQGLIDTPLVKQRLNFFSWAQQAECGVVELQYGFQLADERQLQAVSSYGYAAESVLKENDHYIELPEFATDGLAIEFFGHKGKKQHLARILEGQIRQALQTGEPVNFGNQAPHDVITEVLHRFVFVPPGEMVQPVKMRVVYVDGSEAEPFPLFCLPLPTNQTNSPVFPLRVALMSMRHLELDSEIDYYWFRNRDVSRTRTLAETDQFCFDTTKIQLKDSLALGDLDIHLYHTGFEPAVVGFYRGVVRALLGLSKQQGGPAFSVTPFYLIGGSDHEEGNIWRLLR